MYYFCDEICQAVAESGIKANISRGTSMFLGDDFCFDTFPACRELVELKDKWHNYDNGRIKIEASIHAEYTSTYQLWDALADVSYTHLDVYKRQLQQPAFIRQADNARRVQQVKQRLPLFAGEHPLVVARHVKCRRERR